MMKKFVEFLVVSAALLLLAHTADAATPQRLVKRLHDARVTIDQIMSAPDKGIPDAIAHNAFCVGVVPSVVKAAFVVGAEYGQGVVTCRTHTGWSAPVFIRLAGGSFGLQIGGQGTDLVLVATNYKGMQDLLKDKVKLGADASVAAGPVGRNTQAATDLSMRAEMLTWSRSHGIFAGIDLSGATINQNQRDTDDLYGGEISFHRILKGEVPPTPVEMPFLHTVARYFR